MVRLTFFAGSILLIMLTVTSCGAHAPLIAQAPQGARWFTYHQRFIAQTASATSSTTNNVTTTTVTSSAHRAVFNDKVDMPQDQMTLRVGDTVTPEVLAGRQTSNGFGYQP